MPQEEQFADTVHLNRSFDEGNRKEDIDGAKRDQRSLVFVSCPLIVHKSSRPFVHRVINKHRLVIPHHRY